MVDSLMPEMRITTEFHYYLFFTGEIPRNDDVLKGSC
jgi:hypothetical protein